MHDLKTAIVLAAIITVGMLVGIVEAKLATPFEYVTNGVELVNYELDNNDKVLALDVKVTDTKGTIELTLDRNFFDCRYNGKDDNFLVLADGNEVIYKETKTTQKSRTVTFNVSSDVELVEIFGTHVKGVTFAQYDAITNTQSDQLQKLLSENGILKDRNNKLANEVDQLKAENEALKKENKRLDGRIFELENLVSAMQKKINDLNGIVKEQVKTIFNWVTQKK